MADIVAPDIVKRLSGIIDNSEVVTVVTHTRPDGDAVGSSVAMSCFLRECRGKDAAVVLVNDYSETLDFIINDEDSILMHSIQALESERRIAESDLIICLDFNDFSRTDALRGALESSRADKVLIDHHLNPDSSCFKVCISETGISSASELLFWTLMLMPDISGDTSRIPMHALRAMMAGMTTDTNNFANSVFPSTLQMASQMLSAGVDRDGIVADLYNRYRENRLRMMGYMLKDKMVTMKEGAAYIVLFSDELAAYDIKEGDLEGLVNLPLAIGTVRMSILLKEDKGYFRVSVRSKKGTSANSFAVRYCNGGGHENASGGRLFIPGDIKDSSDAPAYIENKLKEYFGQE